MTENPESDQLNLESVNNKSLKVEAARKRISVLDDTSYTSSRASEVNRKIKRQPKKQHELTHFQQKMIETEKQKVQAFNNAKNDKHDEDMLFLRSLAPYFNIYHQCRN